MTRIVKRHDHPYHSELRAEQAEATGERILDATVRVMAGGLATLSIPAVAREAGVSVPTVYRHFATKSDLLGAVYPFLARRAGVDRMPEPTSVDEFRELIRTMFGRLDLLGEVARAAFASPGSDESRRLNMPARIASVRGFVASVAAAATETERDRITRLLVILASSSAMRMWRDHLGSSVDEAAEDVDWILRAAIAAGTSKKGRKA